MMAVSFLSILFGVLAMFGKKPQPEATGSQHLAKAKAEGLSIERLILARTIYGEARGEGRAGMEAVASVILNRAAQGGWWGSTPSEVALKASQFSVWNVDDPNRAIIERLAPGEGDRVFDQAWEIAGRALDGKLGDRTNGATHYYAKSISAPYWTSSLTETARIGNHIFFT